MQTEIILPLKKLSKDIKESSLRLTNRQVRYLVDYYYIIQEDRKRAGNQVFALENNSEPCDVIQWLFDNAKTLESNIKSVLDVYSASHPVGEWARSIDGIGPVIAAGLLSYIDIHKAPVVGHIWSYAGLNPNVEWLGKERAQKVVDEIMGKTKKVTMEHVVAIANQLNRRSESIAKFAMDENEHITKQKLVSSVARLPWDAGFKTLCWKIGESFVKVCNKPTAFYGRLYLERKERETSANERCAYKELAEKELSTKSYGESTDAYQYYKEGKLPPGRIHARAKRYAVKIFLAHYHEVAYKHEFGKDPPLPYPIAHLGHVHKIEVPV